MVMDILDTTQVITKEGNEGDKPFVAMMDNKTDAKQGNGPDEPGRGLVDNSNGATGDFVVQSADVNFPKDAVDEWPAEKKRHDFYLIRYRTFEDPKLKNKIDNADKEVTKYTNARLQITESLKSKRSERAHVISQLKPLTAEDKQYRMIMDEKRKAMEPLQDALGKLRSANITAREKGVGLCSSEEELNDLIYSLNYRLQHESLTLAEEKQVIKEIKLFEGTREKVIANSIEKAKIQDSFGHKEAIQDQVKTINDNIGGIKKEKQAIRMKIKDLEDELKVIDDEINALQEELETINNKRNKAYETLIELRKARDEVNSCFYQNRAVLNRAKDLASKKDVKSLRDLTNTEVEKFITEWSGKKAFREDYEKRILSSLDNRQLSRDGRMRNPNEKPIVAVEAPATRDLEIAPAKVNAKQSKQDAHAPPQQEVVHSKTAQVINLKKSPEVETRDKMAGPADTVDTSEPDKSQRETSKPDAVDVAKLKEMKREEEIAKAKLALERKKRQADKAESKAAAWAQKEAKKRLKEKKKRAKKRSAAEASNEEVEEETKVSEPAEASNEEVEEETKVSEPEEASANTDAPLAEKTKENVRYRKPKGSDQVPKFILKKKKSNSYWKWAAPAALAAVLFVALGFYFVFVRE